MNVTLIDQSSVKCATIQEVQDFNETLEPIDGDVHIIQPPSSSDTHV